MLTNSIDAKVFIEGIEVPIQSVSIVNNMNTMSYASVTLPPIAEVPDIKARSLIMIGVKDQLSYGGDDYVLQFVGETCEPSVSWSPSGFGLSITAYSLDNHWYAIPVYLNVGTQDRLLGAATPTANDPQQPTASSATPARLSAACGTNIQFDIFGYEAGDKITKSTQPDGNNRAMQDLKIPGMFTSLYTANSFWTVTGERTGMDQADHYYYFSEDIFLKDNLKPLIEKYVALSVQAKSSRNAKFIEYFDIYRRAKFASYALNQQMTTPHVMITTGLDYIFPPACNIIFPHQFTRLSSIGKNLSVGTRTIGILTEAAVSADSATLFRAGGGLRIFPRHLQPLIEAADFNVLREVDPGTEEEWRGVVTNIIIPQNMLLAAMRDSQTSADTLRKYFDYIISDEHVKNYNQNGSMMIPCSFLPNMQVGFPGVAFRPSMSDQDSLGYTVVYGLVESVQHSISASGCFTNVSMRDSKVISGNNAMPTPVPIWINDKTTNDIAPLYKTMLGCNGTVNEAAGGTTEALTQSISSLFSKALTGILNNTASTSAFHIGAQDGLNIIGDGADYINIHKLVMDSVTVIGKNYDTLKTDAQRAMYTNKVVGRTYLTVHDALGKFTFEASRADWVTQYKELLVRENKIVKNEEGTRILNGDSDVKRTEMKDYAAAKKEIRNEIPSNVITSSMELTNPAGGTTKVGVKQAISGTYTVTAADLQGKDAQTQKILLERVNTPIKGNGKTQELTLNGVKYTAEGVENGLVYGSGYSPGLGGIEGGWQGSFTGKLTTLIESSEGSYANPISVAMPQAVNGNLHILPSGTMFTLKGSDLVYRIDDHFAKSYKGVPITGRRIDIATGGGKAEMNDANGVWEIEYILRK